MSAVTKTCLYHITHGENLSSIIDHGGLICCNGLADLDVTSIAYEGIQNRRAHWPVTCGPKGVLHDYVPFYFAARSPMLYAIHKGQVDGAADQRAILHLVTSVGEIQKHDCEFVFTDGHAIIALSEYFEQVDELQEHVDWDLMKSKWWSDTDQDPDRKRRRQAEFLIHRRVPWTCVTEIAVSDKHIADRVREIIEPAQHKPDVHVRRQWYY